MKKLAILILLMFSIATFAVTGPLTANLQTFSSTPANAFITVKLKTAANCLLTTTDGTTIGTVAKNFYPDLTGHVVDVIVPTTTILCNNNPGAAWYHVDVVQRGTNGAANVTLFGADYLVDVSGLAVGTTAPIASTPVAPVANYALRNANNTYSAGTTQDYTGAQLAGLPIAPAFIIDTPDATLDAIFGAYIAQPINLTRVRCSIIGTGSITIQFEARTDPDVSGTAILSSPLVCDATKPFTTSFSQASISAAKYLVLRINAVTSAPNWLRVYIEY